MLRAMEIIDGPVASDPTAYIQLDHRLSGTSEDGSNLAGSGRQQALAKSSNSRPSGRAVATRLVASEPVSAQLARRSVRPLDGGLSSAARYVRWPASTDLAPYIEGFYLHAVGGQAERPHRVALLPGGAHLRFVSSGGNGWRVRPTKCGWIEPGPACLFGPSSSLVLAEATACTLIGAAIRPRGWLKLLDQSARIWTNRIGAPPSLGGADLRALCDQLFELKHEDAIPVALERVLRAALRPNSADDELVARIEAALLNSPLATVGELAGAVDLSVRSLERIANRAFGFGPKLLIRRARFLRSLLAIQEVGPGERSKAIDPVYTDYSHFVRDSHDFLGMAPQVFLRMDLALLS